MIYEFFIIIAGIIVVVALIFIGSMQSSKELREEGKRAQAKAEFNKKFIDIELEKEIDRRVNDINETAAIYEELASDLIEVYGEDYRNIFVIVPDTNQFEFMRKESYWNRWAKRLLLSKQGKYSSDRKIFLGCGRDADENLKLCKAIQRNIREFDPSFSLCLNCDNTTSDLIVGSPYRRFVIPECDFNPPFKIDITLYRI